MNEGVCSLNNIILPWKNYNLNCPLRMLSDQS